MKDILFRGKDKKSEKWIEGGYHKHIMRTPCPIGDEITKKDIEYLIIVSGFSDWNMSKPLEVHSVIPKTIGQFTGKLDINNVKIFEDDIVMCIDGLNREIWWSEDESSFKASYMGKKYYETLYLMEENFEVVGNIHDGFLNIINKI